VAQRFRAVSGLHRNLDAKDRLRFLTNRWLTTLGFLARCLHLESPSEEDLLDHVPYSQVAVIGAGPYGVTTAAHLQLAGIDFRIFGRPMHRWQCRMPRGMVLKSEGCGSSLSDPTGGHTLAQYCAEKQLPYGAWGVPVSIDVFTQYALSFQRELVPNVEDVMVTAIDASNDGFELRLANGTIARAGKVVVATGLEYAAHIPPEIAGLPSGLLSHSSDHHELSGFKGKDVTVIGGGQSALETAALLSELGASVRLLVRKPSLSWGERPRVFRRTAYQRLRYPVSGLGRGLAAWAYCNVPMLFRHLPQQVRLERVKTALGPAGAWWLKDRVVGRLQTMSNTVVLRADQKGSRAVLRAIGPDGRSFDLATDHVIAATGYRFSLRRLPFLSGGLRSRLRTEQEFPALSSNFESSVPGLYFTGVASAGCFGPAMRFLVGTGITGRRVAGHIAATTRQGRSPAIFHFANALKCRES
jgi:thioredoxin reductase